MSHDTAAGKARLGGLNTCSRATVQSGVQESCGVVPAVAVIVTSLVHKNSGRLGSRRHPSTATASRELSAIVRRVAVRMVMCGWVRGGAASDDAWILRQIDAIEQARRAAVVCRLVEPLDDASPVRLDDLP